MPAPASTSITDVFLGSEQSKYAGIALFITILIICLAILFTSSKIPIEQRLVFVLFILILTVPSILMSLFELTCIVTGGNYNTRWWCWALAWVLAIMIIFYCVMIIISLFLSMTNYDLANERISEDIANSKVDTTTDNTNANNYAKNIMNSYEQDSNQQSQLQHQHQQSQLQHQQSQQLQQEYRPPVPHRQDSPVPQQSQHMNYSAHSLPSHSTAGVGDYTGFDSSDNLSPLDTAFNIIKEPAQQQRQRGNVNTGPRSNDTVEPYSGVDADTFSSF